MLGGTEFVGRLPWRLARIARIWIPPGELYDTMHQGDVSKALATGLRCRPIEETVTDTWAWQRQLPGGAPEGTENSPTGISAELEAKLLKG
ncbi:hypothetical protein [Kitasatospora azatica]|uniref:hypothetical protein n=1 Tax=Kitasatospora azatica TaxID=58347 RepID=UPI00055FCF3D